MSSILLIEDDPSAQVLFRNRLEDRGYRVVVASTGARGLMEARKAPYDLFLVDVGLGSGIDGHDVCRRLKSTPQFHNVPVVLISGKLKNREELHRGYEAGCESFLVKGEVTLLEDVVRVMLRLKSLQDDLAMQNRLLGEQNRRLKLECDRGAKRELARRDPGASPGRELAAGRPAGALLVDNEGVVRSCDRGARDLLGKDLDGCNLGSIAPDTGLEAFVRDARTDVRDGFRVDQAARPGREPRSLWVSVVPIVGDHSLGFALRLVLLFDGNRQRVEAELLGPEQQGVPRCEIGPLLEAARRSFHPSAWIGETGEVAGLRQDLRRHSASDQPLLLAGQAGTGKAFAARIIHFSGNLSGPFVPLDCAAIAPALLDSELFGHAQGAFPEALSDRLGLLWQASHGTLFLREVGMLPPAVQAKLLKYLQTGRVEQLGGATHDSTVRVIASSGEDLAGLIESGRFDRELHACFSQNTLVLPSLVEGRADIAPLARHFAARFGASKGIVEVGQRFLEVLEHYDWPGNVRELETCIENACGTARGTRLVAEDLPQHLRDPGRRGEAQQIVPAAPPPGAHLVRAGSFKRQSAAAKLWEQPSEDEDEPVSLALYERKALLRALRECSGDKLAAARLLKIGKSTFYRKLHQHNLA